MLGDAIWRPLARGRREDPPACREQDRGRFEVTQRDGRSTWQIAHAPRRVETQPCRPWSTPTFEPLNRERCGTNTAYKPSSPTHTSYGNTTISGPRHNATGCISCRLPRCCYDDSGTFQSYVYGDVEVGIDEIVTFQRSIGVDIATMLDVFSRPDMNEEEVELAVQRQQGQACLLRLQKTPCSTVQSRWPLPIAQEHFCSADGSAPVRRAPDRWYRSRYGTTAVQSLCKNHAVHASALASKPGSSTCLGAAILCCSRCPSPWEPTCSIPLPTPSSRGMKVADTRGQSVSMN